MQKRQFANPRESLGENLKTLHSRKPHEIREHVLSVVRDVAEADIGHFYTLGEIGGIIQISAWQTVCDKIDKDFLSDCTKKFSARSEFVSYSSTFILNKKIDPFPQSNFLELECLVPHYKFMEGEFYRTVFSPYNLNDQLRLLVYHGNQFVAWVGAFRKLSTPLFALKDRRRMKPLVSGVREALIAADTLERKDLPGGPAYLVVYPDGKVEHASEDAKFWLSRPEFPEALRSVVRAFDAGLEVSLPMLLHPAEVNLTRLDGEDGLRYLVRLLPLQVPRRLVADQLSPAQRQIAEFAIVGATVEEISKAVGRSTNTVRAHLREIYKRLEVANRVELASALRR